MKLRNKKTGEVAELIEYGQEIVPHEIVEFVIETENNDYKYNSLAELSEEWEDYEGPKEQYYIKENGTIGTCGSIEDDIPDEMLSEMKSIGNYFETKEEADKAVEKLKAWKRLKDKGIKTVEWTAGLGDDNYKIGEVMVGFDIDGVHDGDVPNDIEADLDLLFGGEE